MLHLLHAPIITLLNILVSLGFFRPSVTIQQSSYQAPHPSADHLCDYSLLPKKALSSFQYEVCATNEDLGGLATNKFLIRHKPTNKFLLVRDLPVTNVLENNGSFLFSLYRKDLSIPSGKTSFFSLDLTQLVLWNPNASEIAFLALYRDTPYPNKYIRISQGTPVICRLKSKDICVSGYPSSNFKKALNSTSIHPADDQLILQQLRAPILNNSDGRVAWQLFDLLTSKTLRESSHLSINQFKETYIRHFCSMNELALINAMKTSRFSSNSFELLYALHLARLAIMIKDNPQMIKFCTNALDVLSRRLRVLNSTVEYIPNFKGTSSTFLFAKPLTPMWNSGFILPVNYTSAYCQAVLELAITKRYKQCKNLAKYIKLARSRNSDTYYPSIEPYSVYLPPIIPIKNFPLKAYNPKTPPSYKKMDQSFLDTYNSLPFKIKY